MNLIHLEYIVEVAKTGSISTASENLKVTSSGISQAITLMEKELGFNIFTRHRGKGPIPTEKGKKIINLAYEVLSKLQEIKNESRTSPSMETGKLKIAIVGGYMEFFLKPLATFKKIYPKVEVEISEMSSKDIISLIQNNLIDIGLIYFPSDSAKLDSIHFKTMLEGKFKLFVNRHSALSFNKTVKAEELVNHSFVLYEEQQFKEAISNHLIVNECQRILFTTNNIQIILDAVLQNLAITLAPSFTLKSNQYLENEDIISVDIEELSDVILQFGWIRSKKQHSTNYEKDFIDLVNSEFQLSVLQ